MVQLPPDAQQNVNTLLIGIGSISLAVNGWFLRGVAKKLDDMGKEQIKMGNRLTWLEARAGRWLGRRAYDVDTNNEDPAREKPHITEDGE